LGGACLGISRSFVWDLFEFIETRQFRATLLVARAALDDDA
jgi:hypothetical protein